MKKITTVSLICLLFILATVLTLPMISGCAKAAKVAATPLPSALSVGMPSPNRGRFDLPSTGDEVWIIARNEHRAVASQDAPGSGALMTKVDQKEVPLPLKHTEVRAFIQGFIGTVEVSQQFQNPY